MKKNQKIIGSVASLLTILTLCLLTAGQFSYGVNNTLDTMGKLILLATTFFWIIFILLSSIKVERAKSQAISKQFFRAFISMTTAWIASVNIFLSTSTKFDVNLITLFNFFLTFISIVSGIIWLINYFKKR